MGQLLRPYPQYTSVEPAGQGSFSSTYHSLQITGRRRFAGGGSLLVAYTNSKLISNTDTLTSWLETSVRAIQDNNNQRGERSLSSQDVPQRLVISYVLDLPFGLGRKYFSNIAGIWNGVVGGWGIDGVTTFQRGFPLVFANGQANDANLFGASSRPNVAQAHFGLANLYRNRGGQPKLSSKCRSSKSCSRLLRTPETNDGEPN